MPGRRRLVGLIMPIAMGAGEFEDLVRAALDDLPDELAALVENCVILVQDAPPPAEPNLLGLYEGVPLTERGNWYAGVLPDRILIFRLPILAICSSVEDVLDEVRITVVHEIAHYFGIGDARLHELGYG
jgi:predicted Zn-dependent protease with MMP-like domain